MDKDPTYGLEVFRKISLRIATWTSSTKRKATTQGNEVESQFLQLPNELLLLIGEALTPISTLRVRQTCGKLRYILPPDLGLYPLNEFDWEISLLEKRSLPPAGDLPEPQLHRFIAYRNDAPRFRLWCNACRTRHSAYYFSLGQRATPPHKRCCLGMENCFRMCAHRSVTYAEVNTLLQSGEEISCQHDDHHIPQDSSSTPGCHLRKATCRYRPESPNVEYNRWLPLVRIPIAMASSESVSKVKAALNDMSEEDQLCPHLHINDESVLFALTTMLTKARYRMYSHDEERFSARNLPVYSPGSWASKYRVVLCKAVDCSCYVEISRFRLAEEEYDTIVMKIEQRWFHSTPTNAGWISAVAPMWLGSERYPGHHVLGQMNCEDILNGEYDTSDQIENQRDLIRLAELNDVKGERS
ncbi:hypothetical protein BU16DRAFT_540180 [Lophium mytilinum]|uniref:F-box domain-containing protein n=1 Tax=Lophium mytilinum TaxID=390894 RepID=A0A6A6QT92_9PEZI|nr:hypothetical protein BU16DRAFT_540180 [Lophium mytilinum]